MNDIPIGSVPSPTPDKETMYISACTVCYPSASIFAFAFAFAFAKEEYCPSDYNNSLLPHFPPSPHSIPRNTKSRTLSPFQFCMLKIC